MNCNNTIATFLVGNDLDYILFKTAIDLAEQGLGVWVISVKPFSRVPKGIRKPCKEVLQLITFIYLNDFTELLKHLNGIHRWKHVPNVVILENFEQYCNYEYDSRQSAFLTAHLLDCASFLSKRTGSKVLLLIACLREQEEDKRVLKDKLKVFFDMYFDNVLFQDELERDELIKKIKQG